MISRFAPTPSGYLHWGNLYHFALTWTFVRAQGGRLGLRIDDVDSTRVRPEYVQDVFETLQWLGLHWDFGPESAQDFIQNYSQGLRKQEYFDRLATVPTYACDCSRQQIQERMNSLGKGRGVMPGSPYDGHCKNRGLTFVAGVTCLRVEVKGFADTVLWTRDDRPAYHWVSILDDIRVGTTHLIRGEDLRESSALQRQIALVAGENDYMKIEHLFHPLIMGLDGRKLSKSEDADSVHAFRKSGASIEEVWMELAKRANLGVPLKSLPDFCKHVDLKFDRL